MSVCQLLFSLLVTGARLIASDAASEFAKGAGKAAFDALRDRLSTKHKIASIARLQDAARDPAVETAIKDEMAKPEIAADTELLRLAETLRQAITALPRETQARYAVDIERIESGGALLFEAVEGVKAKSATSAGDMTFKNVGAPPGK